MSTNWQDIPRDPLMDDDELEHLYRARMQSSASAEPSKSVNNGPERDVERLNAPKKLPVPSYSKLRRGKVA